MKQVNNLENNIIFINYLQPEDEQKIRAIALTNQSSLLIPELVSE